MNDQFETYTQTVSSWRKAGGDVEIVDLGQLRGELSRTQTRSSRKAPSRPAPNSNTQNRQQRRHIRTMLFADVVGFSKLEEPQIPAFFERYLRKVARLLPRGEDRRQNFFNTWGDGLFMVFDQPKTAVGFALRLRDAVKREDWEAHGLPAGMSIRIALHTGPVYSARDPILKRDNYFGTHVNHAARIEPVVTPGAVYASSETAAVLASNAEKEFAWDDMGIVHFAKKYGAHRLYRLRRRGEPE